MATPTANAVKYAEAQRVIASAMQRISDKTKVAVPPAILRPDTQDARHALESDRIATFLRGVADHLDPGGKASDDPKDLGGIGDGYVHSEAEKAKPEPMKAVAAPARKAKPPMQI